MRRAFQLTALVLGVLARTVRAARAEVHVGATLDFTSLLGLEESQDIKNALELLRIWVDDNGTLEHSDGTKMKIVYDIRNDEGDPQKVRDHYGKMMSDRSADIFLGPQNSLLSAAAADAASTFNRTLMLYSSSALTGLYASETTQAIPGVFSLSVKGQNMSHSVFEALRDAGAPLCKEYGDYAHTSLEQDIFSGAQATATDLGYTVTSTVSVTDEIMLIKEFRKIVDKEPDVVFIGGSRVGLIKMIAVAEELGIRPKAFVSTRLLEQTL
eukprot:CAMPEP_0115130156 /NCGR_PEP_ID=MMETSP0227-20121206/52286_1 /TAXON_ID=89957 /ORGANISM="Polarella glacialis, Strain CCMP 1383" /LENGTH=268 /DNA_ID=CAMNT_0002535297 /DNA_START=267 /DNA_END=1068 /DNA_ORIENTATION=-